MADWTSPQPACWIASDADARAFPPELRRFRIRLLAFMVLSLFSSFWPTWWALGASVNPKFLVLPQYVSPLFLLLAINELRRIRPPLPYTNSYFVKLVFLVVYVALILAYGLVRGNHIIPACNDLWVYVVLYCFLVLGRHEETWQVLEKPLIIMFYVSFAIVMASLGMPRFELAAGGETARAMMEIQGERAAGASLAALGSISLESWSLLFALAYHKRRNDTWKILGLLTIVAYLILAVFLQFRSRFLVTFAYAVVAMVVVPALQRKLNLGTSFLVLVIVAAVAGGVSRTADFAHLMYRFDEGSPFEGRWIEGRALLDDMFAGEYLIGKGLGGAYAAAAHWKPGLAYEDGRYVSRTLHAGVLMPILKGGLILWMICFSFVAPMFLPKQTGWYNSRYNAAAMTVMPVYSLYVTSVPAPCMESFMFIVIAGLSCARFASPVTGQELRGGLPAAGGWERRSPS